ncbi:MAG: DUF424 domain-containing protein [Thermoplasmata archaeon]
MDGDRLICVKIYRKGVEVLLAACDSDILGKTFRDGELRIECSSFYEGEEVSVEVFLQRLREVTIANLVGKETVQAAIDGGFVDETCVIWIGDVPHAQMVVM